MHFAASTVEAKRSAAVMQPLSTQPPGVGAYLANLCLTLGLYASTATFREFNHIHKKGPRIVRAITCLRPIFLFVWFCGDA